MQERYSIVFVTAVWKRPEVFKMFAQGIKDLQEAFKDRLDIHCVVSGSEGVNSTMMVRKEGFEYVECPNDPLGRKMNNACELAAQFTPDYCLMLGSDDVISIDLMEEYYKEMQKGTDYIYITDCYFYDLNSKKSLYWGGYTEETNKGHAAGIGRVLSKRLLSIVDYKPWYDDKMSHILDTAMDVKTLKFNHTKRAINCKESGVMALDIKSSDNMTPFDLWDNSKYIKDSEIKEGLSKELIKIIW